MNVIKASTYSELSPEEIASVRDEWVGAVDELVQEVFQWAKGQPGWEVTINESQVIEEPLGAYPVPVLKMDTPAGSLILEPVAREVGGARGRVDFYAWPTLYRVRLLRRTTDSCWVVRTDSGLDWPQPWNHDTFVTLAQGLLGAS